jgi:hypothetical protein
MYTDKLMLTHCYVRTHTHYNNSKRPLRLDLFEQGQAQLHKRQQKHLSMAKKHYENAVGYAHIAVLGDALMSHVRHVSAVHNATVDALDMHDAAVSTLHGIDRRAKKVSL